MIEYSPFGLEVKTKLLTHSVRTQVGLAKEVFTRTGLFVDGPYLFKILTGQRKAPKITEAIREILDIKYVIEAVEKEEP